MTKPMGSLFSALILCAWLTPVRGASPAESVPSAGASIAKEPIPVPALNPVPPAKGSPAAASKASASPARAVAAVPSKVDPKKRFHRPAPLKRLIFSARQGFSLRMVSSQEVTAEIRNGAGRTLASGAYTLEAGDWTLRPRNLAPGLYTVLLRTGPQLRALRMKIEDSERIGGLPEWVLEKAAASSGLQDASPASQQQGASVFPAPD